MSEIKTITINLDLLKETDYYASVIYAYAKEASFDGRMQTPDGYFMLSNEEIETRLKFTRYQQNEGFKKLKSLGLIKGGSLDNGEAEQVQVSRVRK